MDYGFDSVEKNAVCTEASHIHSATKGDLQGFKSQRGIVQGSVTGYKDDSLVLAQ